MTDGAKRTPAPAERATAGAGDAAVLSTLAALMGDRAGVGLAGSLKARPAPWTS
jgi:hypothetical protein